MKIPLSCSPFDVVFAYITYCVYVNVVRGGNMLITAKLKQAFKLSFKR